MTGQAQPTLEGNICRENQECGIVYVGSAAGTGRGNTCAGNKVGIVLLGAARPALVDNRCTDNVRYMR